MSDEELLLLVPESSTLTPVAQQVLANEVLQRRLKIEEKEARDKEVRPSGVQPLPSFFKNESDEVRNPADYEPGDSYDEDRELVELCTVWSMRDAVQVQTILDDAGIPFFMGPENATGVDSVTSNFGNGVVVKIMKIGIPWAGPAMTRYEPADDPNPPTEEEVTEAPVQCPLCHSTEVVFEGLTSKPAAGADKSSQKFKWTCDSCGKQWEDDGIVEEQG